MIWRLGLHILRFSFVLLAAFSSAAALSSSFVTPSVGTALADFVGPTLRIIGMAAFTRSGSQAVFLVAFILLGGVTLVLLWVGGMKQVKVISVFYLLALAPAILSNSSINWLRFAFQRSFSYQIPPVAATMLLTLVTIASLYSIYLASRGLEESKALATRGMMAADIAAYLTGSQILGGLVMAGAVVLSAAGLLMALAPGKSDFFSKGVPWPLVLLGFGAVSVIAALLYVSLTMQRSRERNPGGGPMSLS